MVAMSLEVLSNNLATQELLVQTQEQARQLEQQNEAASRRARFDAMHSEVGTALVQSQDFPSHDAVVRGSDPAGRGLGFLTHLDARARHRHAGAVRQRRSVYKPGWIACAGSRWENGKLGRIAASRQPLETNSIESEQGVDLDWASAHRAWFPSPATRWLCRIIWWASL